jgi:hypothetical protein
MQHFSPRPQRRLRKAMTAQDCCIGGLLQNRGGQCAAGNFHKPDITDNMPDERHGL